jgi:hypothetical protein
MTSYDADMLRISRRNKLVGMWAAEKLGLAGESANAYSSDLGTLDFERNDILAIIRKDFDAAGVVETDDQIMKVVNQAWLAAGRQTNSADASDVALVQIVRNLRSP